MQVNKFKLWNKETKRYDEPWNGLYIDPFTGYVVEAYYVDDGGGYYDLMEEPHREYEVHVVTTTDSDAAN